MWVSELRSGASIRCNPPIRTLGLDTVQAKRSCRLQSALREGSTAIRSFSMPRRGPPCVVVRPRDASDRTITALSFLRRIPARPTPARSPCHRRRGGRPSPHLPQSEDQFMPVKNSKRNQSLKAGKKRRAAQSRKKAGEQARKTHAKGAAVPKTVGRAPKKKRAVAAFAPVVPDPTLDNLKKIEHIVVLMMENRSFDHVLGYLTLEKWAYRRGRPDEPDAQLVQGR